MGWRRRRRRRRASPAMRRAFQKSSLSQPCSRRSSRSRRAFASARTCRSVRERYGSIALSKSGSAFITRLTEEPETVGRPQRATAACSQPPGSGWPRVAGFTQGHVGHAAAPDGVPGRQLLGAAGEHDVQCLCIEGGLLTLLAQPRHALRFALLSQTPRSMLHWACVKNSATRRKLAREGECGPRRAATKRTSTIRKTIAACNCGGAERGAAVSSHTFADETRPRSRRALRADHRPRAAGVVARRGRAGLQPVGWRQRRHQVR